MKQLLWLFLLTFAVTQVFAQPVIPVNGQYQQNNELTSVPGDVILSQILAPKIRLPNRKQSDNNYKALFTSVERLDSILLEEKPFGSWIPATRITFTWNNQQQLIQHETQRLIPDTIMPPRVRNSFTYDAAGNIVEELTEEDRINAGVYELFSKSLYTWNQGVMETSLYYRWDDISNQWLPKDSITYFYNPNSTLASYVKHRRVYSLWKLDSKEEYTYNAQGELIELISSYYNEVTQLFVPWRKDQYQYHPNGKLYEAISLSFDVMNNTWGNVSRDIFLIDQSGNTIGISKDYYNTTTMQWTHRLQENRTFDPQNNMTERKLSQYDETANMWIDMSNMEYTFNNIFPYNLLLLPMEYYSQIWFHGHPNLHAVAFSFEMTLPEFYNHMITHSATYTYDPVNANLMEYNRGTFHWSTQIIGIEKTPPAAGIVLYPNPAENFVYVDAGKTHQTGQITIYDIQGRMITNRDFNFDKMLDIKEINNGIYIYQIHIGDDVLQTGKLIIQKR